ncbi:MAG: hypothetical protein Harvfovirus15_2 [Harvfovirus sp.]|uniref:MORN repeat-containing protein n=1 Tax=Harvfovirus sp. TaxID=2487768 RepID=A0A3G5A1G2_9VIRU|nr:MAG: hypothetical protein Harvfovirus15_2 [Harvfovirus sp.]
MCVFETECGTRIWYFEGKIHRCGGEPAIEHFNGDREWFIHGKRHRDGAAAWETIDGNKYWYKNGQLHREDGPACETRWTQRYYINGQLHRLNGPAIIYQDKKKNQYWINNKRMYAKFFVRLYCMIKKIEI